jgi:hypothetical protein
LGSEKGAWGHRPEPLFLTIVLVRITQAGGPKTCPQSPHSLQPLTAFYLMLTLKK